jgi:hypothetical protein
MTLNDQIGALVLKNTRINPVNQTAYKNAFLLLSSTRALNELVSNTKPSDRARKEGIEDDAAYLKTPSGAKSDRTDPDAPDPKAPKPKARKKAAPKTDATPAQKPKAAPKKTAPAPAPKKTAPAPAPKRGRKNDPVGVKDQKAAARDATAKAMNSALKGVAKGVKSKIYTDAAKAGKARVANKVKVDNTAKLNAETKVAAKETAKLKAETAKIAKQMEARREGEPIPLGNTKLRNGNSSDRRLGTKTQKKKK